jgi:hypothetical protein
MKTEKSEISLKKIVSILSIASFLTVAQVATTTFAEEWQLWPKGRNPAADNGKPETPETAAAGIAGEEAGKTVDDGLSAGTIGFSAAVVAVTIAIGITVFSGGSSAAHH